MKSGIITKQVSSISRTYYTRQEERQSKLPKHLYCENLMKIIAVFSDGTPIFHQEQES